MIETIKPIMVVKYPLDFGEDKRKLIYDFLVKLVNNIYSVYMVENAEDSYLVKFLNIEASPELEQQKEIILLNLTNIRFGIS